MVEGIDLIHNNGQAGEVPEGRTFGAWIRIGFCLSFLIGGLTSLAPSSRLPFFLPMAAIMNMSTFNEEAWHSKYKLVRLLTKKYMKDKFVAAVDCILESFFSKPFKVSTAWKNTQVKLVRNIVQDTYVLQNRCALT